MPTTHERVVFSGDDKTKLAFNSINKNTKRLNDSGRRINQTFGALRGIIAGVAVGLVVRKINAVVGSVNELAKAAKAAGFEAESIQELRFALGQLSSLTDAEVDKSLSRFNKRLGEAIGGTGSAKKTLELMNIEFRNSSGEIRKTDDVLREVFVSLAAVEDGNVRAGMAAQLFGSRQGPKLAQALEGGIASVDELTKKARDMGLVLSNETAAGAEEAADKIDLMKRKMGAEFNRAVLTNVDNINTLVGALTRATTWFVNATSSAVGFIEKMARAMAAAGIETDLVKEIRLRKEALGILQQLSALEEKRGGLGVAGQIDNRTQRLREINAELKRIEAATQARLRRPLDAPSGSSAVVKQNEEEKQSVKVLKDTYEDLTDTAKKETSDLERTIENSFDNAGDALADFVTTGKLSFRDMINSMLRDLARLAIQKAIVDNLTGAISGLFSGGGSANVGGLQTGVPINLPPATAFTAASGADFIVGGRGGTDSQRITGMVTPGERVTVQTPAQQRRGGMTVNLTINAPGADAGTFARLREMARVELIPQAVNAATKNVLALQNRPSFS
jgi:hypothetical protein